MRKSVNLPSGTSSAQHSTTRNAPNSLKRGAAFAAISRYASLFSAGTATTKPSTYFMRKTSEAYCAASQFWPRQSLLSLVAIALLCCGRMTNPNAGPGLIAKPRQADLNQRPDSQRIQYRTDAQRPPQQPAAQQYRNFNRRTDGAYRP